MAFPFPLKTFSFLFNFKKSDFFFFFLLNFIFSLIRYEE